MDDLILTLKLMANEKTMTVLQLLAENLPPKYVSAIVRNLDDPSVLSDEAQSIEEELLTLFDWEESNEGYEFWSSVLEYIITKEGKLPPLSAQIEWKPTTFIVTKKGCYIMNVSGVGYNIYLGADSLKPTEAHSLMGREMLYQWQN